MAKIIYLTCAAMCLLCTILLFKQWLRSKVGLLFWSAVCFFTLTAANILLFVDLIVMPQVNLADYRSAATLLAILFMLWGLIIPRRDR